MAIVRAVLVVALLIVGAAGLSSLEDDDFCGAFGAEAASLRTELALWPPGTRCVSTLPDGTSTSLEAGSAGAFLVLLASLLAVAAWKVARPERARYAFAVALAFAVAGAAGLEGAWQASVAAGLVLGVPLALFAGGPAGALAAAAALPVATLLSLLGLGPAAFLLPLALVSLARPPRSSG